MATLVPRSRRHRSDRTGPAEPALFRSALVFLAVTLLVGAAGARYHLLTLLVEGAGIALLWVAAMRRGSGVLSPDRLANVILVLAAALPAIQLVPLPYPLWSGLPGREVYGAVLDAAGLAGESQPTSLHAYATWGSLLALLPAGALFLVASRFDERELTMLLHVVLVGAVISAVLGILQKASGGTGLAALFPTAHTPDGPGLFANRNHQAALMNLCIPVAAGTLWVRGEGEEGWKRALAVALMILFAGTVVATASRMGLAVLPVAIGSALLIMAPASGANTRRNILLGVLGLAAVAVIALQSSGVQVVLRRFAGTDVRIEYWTDTMLAIGAFWPVGSGFGTFQDVYQAFEDLNVVVPSFPYNAHNDYLELALEGGAPAMIVLAAFVVWLVLRTKALLRPSGGKRRPLQAVALSAIMVLLLHSIVDYPLRTYTLMTAFALMCAILAAKDLARTGGGERHGGHARR